MKIHSYMTVNGYLQNVSAQSQNVLDGLREAADSFGGGWARALEDAKAHKRALDRSSGMSAVSSDSDGFLAPPTGSDASSTPIGTPPIPTSASGTGLQTSYVDSDTASTLRKRLVAMSDANGNVDVGAQDVVKGLTDPRSQENLTTNDRVPSVADPHPLTDHPDERISDLAKEYTDLQGELSSSGPLYVVWPNNISLKNFATYMLIPTLVYELEYPRTDK